MHALLVLSGAAFLLGLKHSSDADHVAALSTALSSSVSRKQALRASLFWALGHILTGLLLSFLILSTGFRVPFGEQLVGGMLIFLGVRGLRKHARILVHTHGPNPHTHLVIGKGAGHRHVFGIGVVHGLASNDELFVLLISLGLSGAGSALLGFGMLSLGILSGMALLALLLSSASRKLASWLPRASCLASLLLGIFLLSPLL